MRWELLRVPSLLKKVGATSIAPNPGQMSAELIRKLKEGLPWDRATFSLHFAALKQFIRWAGNPLADQRSAWSLPSGGPTRQRWLTKAQLSRLYRAARGPARLLVGLEGLNGLRRVEVLRLRWKDVSLAEESLLVLGKGRDGGKWRRIPLHPSVRRDFAPLIKEQEPDGRVIGLSKSGADLLLARAVRAAQIPNLRRVSHHDLRRTFGRLAHDAGMDLVQLKNLLGHASSQMTEHYIGLDSTRMREGLGKFAQYLGSSSGDA